MTVVRKRWLSILVLVEWAVIAVLAGILIIVGISYGQKLSTSFVTSAPTREVASVESSPQIVFQSPTVNRTSLPSASPMETPGRATTQIKTTEFLPTSQQTSVTAGPVGRIVFTCTPDKYNQLCLMNADGSGLVRLTDRKANDYYPSFSPDGRSITFVSNQTGQFEIYTLNSQWGEERRVTDGVGNVAAPDISPDGQWIVYASKLGGDSSIWLIPREGGQPQPLTDSRWNEVDPAWSPDGKQIVFAGARGGFVELFVATVEGVDFRNLSEPGSSLPLQQVTQDVPGIGGRSSWSPDGTKLVFYAGPRGERDIYVVDVVNGVAKRLTFGGNNSGPCFSPDGDWIAFSSSRDGDHEIFIMRNDGEEITQLTDNSYDDWQPSWGP